ncbi:MAG: EF-P lysine aminoacylase EpmA [Candidatus Magasanikbacteria bacterium]|nr:EF-P lysine aminoacylase EpmA [Candidatus Magasanikbacteria bacterium]
MSKWSDLKNNPRLNEIFKKRLEITRLIREFFWSENFQEAETPVAVRLPGQEPYLNPIPVLFHDPNGIVNKFYLQTSPEFAMKKLLAVGYEKIFQICKCFRDFEQFGGNHNTEFTMIEWYRASGTLEEIMDDTERLFKYVATGLKVESLKSKDHVVPIFGEWERLSMREVWKKYSDVELNDYLTSEKMAELVKARGYAVEEKEAFEDLFYKIFLNEIEPKLGMQKPIMIYDYPEQMTSLSRLSKNDPRYAERFELYIAGLEMANAFGELTDAVEQKKRLEADREKRAQMGKETWPVDSDFISALESGIPNAGGIALGVDRMIMLFTGAKDINEVIFQAVGDQLSS